MTPASAHLTATAADTSVDTLLAMLEVKRPHNSVSETAFIRHFLQPLGMQSDTFGNLWKRVGTAPVVLWSTHTDSCHRTSGLQDIVCEENIVHVADAKLSNCLGADDAAGVWLMTQMIAAQIPGLYVFHRGEERGGLGSAHFAEHNAKMLTGIKAAIAFDRRGTGSIITHQRGDRCCSETFAWTLSEALGLGHQPDPTGSFTDTANYADLVGECTNVSVGYDNEHSPDETLDLGYLVRLRDAVLAADFSRLAFERQPGEVDTDASFGWHSGDEVSQDWSPRLRSILYLVRQHPEAIADFLELSGVSARELQEFIDADIPF